HYLQFSTSNAESVHPAYKIDGAITLGGWFSVDATQSGVKGLISNGLATFNPSTHNYGLIWNANQPQFAINNTTGSSYETVTAVSSPTIGDWFHIVGRFTPGAEIAIFINDQKTTAATTITSTANGNGQTVGVGQLGAGYGRLTSGKCQRAWILNTALPDKDITFIYQNQRHLFGV
ncbi:MAG: LamG domain-containing protein, partial [Rhodobacteraceae bacterium]|nr:LamG domain-containing protein [Paracoccaceae bacterium]